MAIVCALNKPQFNYSREAPPCFVCVISHFAQMLFSSLGLFLCSSSCLGCEPLMAEPSVQPSFPILVYICCFLTPSLFPVLTVISFSLCRTPPKCQLVSVFPDQLVM